MATTCNNKAPFVPIKPGLHQVIEVMESLFGGADRQLQQLSDAEIWPEGGGQLIGEEALQLEYSPHKAVLIDQTRCIWRAAVKRNVPTIWLGRTHRPITLLFSAICEIADVSIANVADAFLAEADFPCLTAAVGALAGSPLWLCDANSPELFQNALTKLAHHEAVGLVICDWCLDGEELETANDVAEKLGMSFVCPKW